MLTYQHADFTANPIKYQRFRTAKVARHIVSEPVFTAGEHVSVRFYAVCRNALYRRDEPVYEITAIDGRSTHAYAGALADFCL